MGNFFAIFGLTTFLNSEQGREFESAFFKELCHILEIDKTRTSPWRPQIDGMVERFNRTFETMVRQIVADGQWGWDRHLLIVCMACRAVVHEATGESPNRLMLGRELPLPITTC